MGAPKKPVAAQATQPLSRAEARLIADFRRLSDETQDFWLAVMADAADSPLHQRKSPLPSAKPISGTNVFALHSGVRL
jgi:hypothetical protein